MISWKPNSMEAVAQIKRASDSNDTMHIYKINTKHMNDQPDYIFKTSRIMMEMALKMDQNTTENSLQEELCFFDDAHSRVQGFCGTGCMGATPKHETTIQIGKHGSGI